MKIASNMDDSTLNDSRMSVNDSRIHFVQPHNYTKSSANNKKVGFGDDDLYLQEDQHVGAKKPQTLNPNSNTHKTHEETQPKKRIQINFGAGAVQDKIYNFKNNYISTTKYQNSLFPF